MKNKLILYHANCYDGFGSAYAAWKKFGDDAEYIPVNYGQNAPDVVGKNVYILDFAYDPETLQKMSDQANLLVVIDHHKTHQENLKLQLSSKEEIEDFMETFKDIIVYRKKIFLCIFDINKSGAVLSWEFFHPSSPVPEFFLYLQDRDLWKFELDQSREVSQALRAYPFDFKIWDFIIENENKVSSSLEQLKKEGKTINRFTEQMVEIMCNNAYIGIVQGHKVPIANATIFFSEVGERLCELYPDCPFSLYYSRR